MDYSHVVLPLLFVLCPGLLPAGRCSLGAQRVGEGRGVGHYTGLNRAGLG